MPPDVLLRPELPRDFPSVEALYRVTFGPGRLTRTAYRLRGDDPHDIDVSFVAERRGLVIGAIRQSRVRIGGSPAYILGPLAVAETAAKQGIGRALLLRTIAAARETAAEAIVLVGDPPFYGPSGFEPAAHLVMLPGPVEKHRVLMLPLKRALRGMVSGESW
ncbi:N-acetyltransferase [Acuticoccus sp. MNP-M23]|uniref:GNAT family N-acetyltransferase n=1 Tax=Acuticoccus sp. MNP-M23 TaxID=3072793 RepID=UPI002815781A|nr:N-acetyltransferase [Acuticoccus sp. MNP-M23]WMS42760.1 N-acetyltransferase [Acuticoccus sp. MNP-M23]